MEVALLVSFAVLLLALVVMLPVPWKRSRPAVASPDVSPDDTFAREVRDVERAILELDARMSTLEADHLEVRAAVAHGIEDIERVDNRIKATIRRTTRQLEEAGVESPALSAEAEHFRVIDGGAGDEGELPQVQEDLGDAPSSIPGVSAAELAKVRGFYGGA